MSRDEFIRKIFSSVAPRIDFLSTLFSLGLDDHWRRKAVSYLNEGENVLDVCTGTGKLAFLISKKVGRRGFVWGIDINEDLLQIARRDSKNNGNLSFITADSRDIPFDSEFFDAVTVSFGIRNITQPEKALQEYYRVLKKGGRFVCLELMKPENRFFRYIWRIYVSKIIPVISKLIIGDPVPYKYLFASIEGFYTFNEFVQLLKKNGFEVLVARSLTFGVANLFVAEKR
ncbi:MAG: bifunctional demethylmenaquinone methyltransferase/2-methoxy-6-polyprenyl-1,4-benzoquinol methylase UbiE [Thermodesulfovibrionales bacterium]|nr:bifunctional demethylmenaquinone methyltransferase/2-methoxy-6-polyprenyl-1,4-benzoquinol methylase UbiE [Thermodesulfovibrionales bacterium]